jgi:response regulator RpfG family c-di-GMP phosphodiesterase
MERTLTRILCVDDEPHVLDGLTRNLRRHFTVVTAPSGAAGIEVLERDEPFAVVVSDMRMPGMDGAAFLARAKEVSPDSVRVLLTGQADLQAAIAAVNEGNIFRFLSKPCPPEQLIPALEAAAEQHRLVTAERVLLQQTLHGSIKTLTDILALASPVAFGRATRVKQQVTKLAAHLGAPVWELEVAAMLSQVGCITLPPQTAEKIYHGRELTPAERQMVEQLPAIAGQLLTNIPRLEAVRDALVYQSKRFDGVGPPADRVRGAAIPLGARVLKLLLDFDALEAQGVAAEMAIDTLRGREGWYDATVLDAFAEILGRSRGTGEMREMRLRDVRPGMAFAEDVTTRTGVLLIARGQEVTVSLLERIRNFSEHIGVKEPVRMILAGGGAGEPGRAALPVATVA